MYITRNTPRAWIGGVLIQRTLDMRVCVKKRESVRTAALCVSEHTLRFSHRVPRAVSLSVLRSVGCHP